MPDKACSVSVLAHEPWNDTGIDVAWGEVLRFSTRGTWCDAHYQADASGYDAPIWVRFFDHWRRCPDAEWFELCGIVGRGSTQAFAIGARGEVAMPAAGRLFLFANDMSNFYWNNSGKLDVTVTRPKG